MNRKKIKYVIIALVAIIIVVLLVLVYNELFAESNDSRLKDIDKYTLSKEEIKSAKEKVNELDGVKDVDVYTDFKIIKIVVKLDSDVDFETVKGKANEVIGTFSEENLGYFDLEFFVDSSNEESTIYPKIGYKHKSKTEFSW